MNSSITFTDAILFDLALNALALDAAPVYEADRSNLTINCDDVDALADVLRDNGVFSFKVYNAEDEPSDGFLTDAEADADALASAGLGTDEDYYSDSYFERMEGYGCLGDECI